MLDLKLLLPLVTAEKQHILELYIYYWQLGWQHFLKNNLSPTTKEEQIRLLEKAIRKDFPLKNNLLAKLQRIFVAENLSLYLLLDLLSAWKYLTNEAEIKTEAQLSDIIGYAASPLARMIMALNNEVPSTYLPMQSLLCAMMWYNLTEQKSPLLQKIKLSAKQKSNKQRGLLQNATVLLAIVSRKRLKFQIALLLNRLNAIMQNNKQARLCALDELKIFLYSAYQFMVVRKRTLTQKGI